MRKLFFILFPLLAVAQTDQFKAILLSKQIGKEVSSYRDGYGTFHKYKSEAGIVDSLGNITFYAPKNGYISNLGNKNFILYVEGENYNRKSAIIDAKGNQIIPLDDHSFSNPWINDKVLIVNKSNLKSIYDINGKQIIPYSDDITLVDDERILVKNNKDWLLYDFNGNNVSERKFANDFYFINGRALIENGNTANEIIDINGKTIHLFPNFFLSDISSYPILKTQNSKRNKFGLIDLEGNVLAEEIYDNIVIPFSNEEDFLYLEKDNKTTIFNKKNLKIYPTNEKNIRHLFNNYFATYNDKTQKSKIFILNSDKKLETSFELITDFSISGKNYLFLKDGNEENLLDEKLQQVYDTGYKLIAVFSNRVFLEKENKYFSLNFRNQKLEELQNIINIKKQNLYFYNPIYKYSLPIICRNSDEKYGILDENQVVIIPFEYDDIISFPNFENQVILKKGTKFGVSNYENEPLTEIEFDKYIWQKEVLKMIKGNKSEFINFTLFSTPKTYDK